MYTVWHLGESGKSRHFSVDPIPRHSSFNPSLIFFSSFFYLAPFPPFRNHQLHQVILSRAPFVSKIQRATRISQLWKILCFHRISPSFFFFWSLTMVRWLLRDCVKSRYLDPKTKNFPIYLRRIFQILDRC